MGFLKKLFGGMSAASEKRYYIYKVKCNRCGEVIAGRLDLDNDLSLSDEGNRYIVRKGLIGNNRCFQRIEVEMQFTRERKLIEKQAQGGTFVE